MRFVKTTEQDSNYKHLEKMSINALLVNINSEDKTVASAVEKVIPQIERLVTAIVKNLKLNGRLFFIVAGTIARFSI